MDIGRLGGLIIRVLGLVLATVLIIIGKQVIYARFSAETEVTLDLMFAKGSIGTTSIGLVIIFFGLFAGLAVILKKYKYERTVTVGDLNSGKTGTETIISSQTNADKDSQSTDEDSESDPS